MTPCPVKMMSNSDAFYNRPMVERLRKIFCDPQPPARVTQKTFDYVDDALRATARKAWHEIGWEDYWHYLLDLCYVPLQKDLFDYLFPAFLIRWWEGQLSRHGGPESECDFYRAIDGGDVLQKMMSPRRRNAVQAWMVDAYMDGVDAWGGHLSVQYRADDPDDLHGPLWSFNALGQSVPIIPQIWEQLTQVETAGRAQWWLVLATGLAFTDNTCPAIPGWNPKGGGGGVYALGSEAQIYDHGYLQPNLAFIRAELTAARVFDLLTKSIPLLTKDAEVEWAMGVRERMMAEPEWINQRIARFLELLGEPDLGGVVEDF